MRQGVNLTENNSTVADTTPVFFPGGRSVLVLIASTFPTTLKLMMVGPDGSTGIALNGTTYSANQVTAYDLPEGMYYLHMASGSASEIYASLVQVPYV